MRKILLILPMLCLSVLPPSKAQSSNADNIKLNITKPLVFSFATIDELIDGKTLQNAIEVKLKVKNQGYLVSASVNFPGLSQNNDLATHLGLRLSTKDSYTATIASNTVMLNQTPALLFQQPGAGPSTQHYSFVYDVLMSPFNTFTSTGNYNFTITFTMTNL